MNLNRRKTSKFPRKKVCLVVQTAIPKGKQFTLQVINSNIGKMKIVRVVTSAWKNLSPAGRIQKLLRAADAGLTDAEKGKILRFSVLTKDELRRVGTPRPRRGKLKLPRQSAVAV